MLQPEGIKRDKGDGLKAEIRVITLIEAAPEDLSINEEGDTTEWIFKWHICDIQEKGQLRNYQGLIM